MLIWLYFSLNPKTWLHQWI